jgi:hypothetical protein
MASRITVGFPSRYSRTIFSIVSPGVSETGFVAGLFFVEDRVCALTGESSRIAATITNADRITRVDFLLGPLWVRIASSVRLVSRQLAIHVSAREAHAGSDAYPGGGSLFPGVARDLVQFARERQAAKRGGQAIQVSLSDAPIHEGSPGGRGPQLRRNRGKIVKRRNSRRLRETASLMLPAFTAQESAISKPYSGFQMRVAQLVRLRPRRQSLAGVSR